MVVVLAVLAVTETEVSLVLVVAVVRADILLLAVLAVPVLAVLVVVTVPLVLVAVAGVGIPVPVVVVLVSLALELMGLVVHLALSQVKAVQAVEQPTDAVAVVRLTPMVANTVAVEQLVIIPLKTVRGVLVQSVSSGVPVAHSHRPVLEISNA